MKPDRSQSSSGLRVWLPVLLMLVALVLRVLSEHHLLNGVPNLSPIMAFAFAGAVVFPRPLPWWSWVAVLLAVDILSQGTAWWTHANGRLEVLSAYGCYALAAWWGARLRGRAGVLQTLGGTLAFSVLFYLVTNTASWLVEPAYVKNFAGWKQALTVGTGLPGLPPTLAFFRNSLVADMIGAAVLLAVYNAEALVRNQRAMPWFGSRRTQAMAA